jgi:hypothetical protein
MSAPTAAPARLSASYDWALRQPDRALALVEADPATRSDPRIHSPHQVEGFLELTALPLNPAASLTAAIPRPRRSRPPRSPASSRTPGQQVSQRPRTQDDPAPANSARWTARDQRSPVHRYRQRARQLCAACSPAIPRSPPDSSNSHPQATATSPCKRLCPTSWRRATSPTRISKTSSSSASSADRRSPPYAMVCASSAPHEAPASTLTPRSGSCCAAPSRHRSVTARPVAAFASRDQDVASDT